MQELVREHDLTRSGVQQILAADLIAAGVPPVGAPTTSHDLLLRIEIPTARDPVTFETTVEILRTKTRSKKWKR